MRTRIKSCILLLLLSVPSDVLALDPHKLITQYGHLAWRTQDGDLNTPSSIAQTTDGYIWIGTFEGLVRFDGARFTLWKPPEGQSLPARSHNFMLAGRDGTLWIATTGGLTRLRDGQLFNYSPPSGGWGASNIFEDRDGTIWVTRYRVSDGQGPLCRVSGDTLQCFGEKDGISVKWGFGITQDTRGDIWFGSTILTRWSPGSSTVYFKDELKNVGGESGVEDLAAGESGSLWAALNGVGPKLGVRYFSDGKWSSYVVPGFDGSTVRSHTLYRDRNHSLWVGTENQGLYRIHEGIADHYGMANGLSGNTVVMISEDREGNLWVVTDKGVDFFRDTPVVSFSTTEGLSAAGISSILALRDGSVWIANEGAVNVIRGSKVLSISPREGLPGQLPEGMFQDRAGRVWVGIDNKLAIYENSRFSTIPKPAGASSGPIRYFSFTEDPDGNIWALEFIDPKIHLIRIRDQRIQEDIPLDDSFRRAKHIAADRDGGIWIGNTTTNRLARYYRGKMETTLLDVGGESYFSTFNLFVDEENALWASTNNGVQRLKDGQLTIMNTRNGLPNSVVYASIFDDHGSLWLYASGGLMKIPAEDVATWLQAPESKLHVKTFDALDGAHANAGNMNDPRVSKSPDGRLWFATNRLVQVIDPRLSYTNTIEPPVQLERVISDGKIYTDRGPLKLPPLHNQLEFDYTALSFIEPRKVNFRYKLEGHDDEWVEAGTRRQAFYNNLPPASYRFRVIACNNDGVWNEAGATLDVIIAPRWYQTILFRVLSLLAIVLVVWSLYRLRVRQVAKTISARFDERLAERTRLARELHDTLLQTVQGSKLVADDALEYSNDPVRLRRALKQVSGWLEQATQEGRAALNSLRTSTTERNDLAAAFRGAIEDCRTRNLIEASFDVIGSAKEMHPIVRDEVYRIGYEAIRNSCEHSKASRLEVKLKYAHDLSLNVRDNGIGIDPSVLQEGKEGHFGLQGIRERADRIGARLTLVSTPDTGTQLDLNVPGDIIFRKTGATKQRWLKTIFRRTNGKAN
jgi:signal transduction histidine kinase/ligand-binding sensor domain-containing protein